MCSQVNIGAPSTQQSFQGSFLQRFRYIPSLCPQRNSLFGASSVQQKLLALSSPSLILAEHGLEGWARGRASRGTLASAAGGTRGASAAGSLRGLVSGSEKVAFLSLKLTSVSLQGSDSYLGLLASPPALRRAPTH